MIELFGTALRIGTLPTLAWEAAINAHLTGTSLDSDDRGVFLRAAEVLLDDGSVEAGWAEAIKVAATARSGLVMVATLGNVVFLSTVHLGPTATVVARTRAVSDGGVLTRMEPVVEVSLTPASDTWEGLARVLPPPFEATPVAGRRTPVSAAGLTVPETATSLQQLIDWEAAPDDLRRALEAAVAPDATVAVAWGAPNLDGPNSVLWFAKGQEIVRVDRATAEQVQPGDCGAELVALAASLR